MGEEGTSMGHSNQTVDWDETMQELSYEEKLNYVNEIAEPMAGKKLARKLYKAIKKASKNKSTFANGLKDVQKRIKKGERGIVVMAGNVTPIDVVVHLPGVCESRDIPYCYVPSRFDLGTAMGARRGSLIVLIKPSEEYNELYEECLSEINLLPPPF